VLFRSGHARQLAALAAASRGTIAAAMVSFPADPTPWQAPPTASRELAAATWARPIDHTWRRVSFSGLTATAHDRPPPPDAETGRKDDEPNEDDTGVPGTAPLPFDDVGGLEFGTLVHDILEKVDPRGPDLRDRLLAASRTAIAHSGLPVAPEDLAIWLDAAARTPLFADPASPTLQALATAGWVPELGFELPVAAHATNSGAAIGTADLADLFEAHHPVDHVLAPYHTRLRDLEAPRFRGYLNGFVDLVARLPGDDTFWVIDYKTNRLSSPAGRPADQAYFPPALAEEMIREHYVLQALLYQIALHRYLRSRLRAYNPATHLGGAMYLFLRGMSGPTTPEADGGRRGVFTWPAPVALILAVDDLLRRGRPA